MKLSKFLYINLLIAFVFFGFFSVAKAQQCFSGSDCSGGLIGWCTPGSCAATNGQYSYACSGSYMVDLGGGMCATFYQCGTYYIQGQTVSGTACVDGECQCQALGGWCQSGPFSVSPYYTYYSEPYACPGGGGGGSGSGGYCGDTQCNNGETSATCAVDCPAGSSTANFSLSVSPLVRSILSGETTSYTVTLKGGTPVNWTYCADEDGTCSFSGTRRVRYGANTSYNYTTASNSVGCNNTVFGDPIYGTVKHCDYATGDTYTLSISGCPTGATCAYSGGNTVTITDPTTPITKTVTVVASSVAPSTYTLTFGVSNPQNQSTSTQASLIVSSLSRPNLVAGAIEQARASVGTTLWFTTTISNRGDASTGTSFSNFFQVASASDGGGIITDLQSASLNALGASGSSPLSSHAYTFATEGVYSVRACADKSSSSDAGTIAESNENDNCGPWTTITVSAEQSAIPSPTNLLGSCPSPGTSGSVSWTLPSGYTQALLRVEDTASDAACSSGTNQLCTGPYTGTSYSFNGSSAPAMVPGHTYNWSVRTYSASTGQYSSAAGGNFTCTSSAATQYTLTVVKTIGGTIRTADGQISCGTVCTKQYNQGASVTLQALPDTLYWKFVGWGGACSGQGTGDCLITVNGNTTVTAQFRPKSLLYQEF